MKQTLFILCGEAFAGKSTISKEISKKFNAKIIGRDEAYFALDPIFALEETPWEEDSEMWENLWPLVIHGTKNQLRLGNSVVIDDTCIQKAKRDALRRVAEECGAKNVLIFIDTPKEIREKRHADNRISGHRHDVPSAWVKEDSKEFEKPTLDEKPIIYTPEMTPETLLQNLSNL